MEKDFLQLGKHRFASRLIVGTGKYPSFEIMRRCHEEARVDCVTVAVRRVNLDPTRGESLLDYIDRKKITLLPNTAGCFNVEDAVRTARLAREALQEDLVKLEVLGDEKTLLPDPLGTLEATKELVRDGFTVLVYCSDDPILAKRIEEAGASAVMPAGSPIGSGQGTLNPNNIRIILESAKVPVIIDAGMGTASDVALAMELGVSGILLNTGIACAKDPVNMARSMALACEAGRLSYAAGRIPRKLYGSASSPMEGRIGI